jgi:adenylate kinase family enzyme
MRIVVMGVAGSGKTTVGLRIAAALGKEDKMNHCREPIEFGQLETATRL